MKVYTFVIQGVVYRVTADTRQAALDQIAGH